MEEFKPDSYYEYVGVSAIAYSHAFRTNSLINLLVYFLGKIIIDLRPQGSVRNCILKGWPFFKLRKKKVISFDIKIANKILLMNKKRQSMPASSRLLE